MGRNQYWALLRILSRSQEKISEKLTSTGILWRKGFDTLIRGNLACWIRKTNVGKLRNDVLMT